MNAKPDELDSVNHLIALGYVDPDVAELQKSALHDRREETLRQVNERLKQGELAAAAAVLEQSIIADSDWIAAHQSLAEIYARVKNWNEVQRRLNWLTWHGIESPRLSFIAGAAALARRDLPSALDSLEYAHYTEPSLPGLKTLLANVFVRLQRLVAAEVLFQQAIALNPSDANAMAGQSQVCLKLGKFAAAADWALQALEHNLHLAPAHYYLGIALKQLGQTDAARQAFESYAKLNPERTAPYRWLMRIADACNDGASRLADYRSIAGEIIARRRQLRTNK